MHNVTVTVDGNILAAKTVFTGKVRGRAFKLRDNYTAKNVMFGGELLYQSLSPAVVKKALGYD